MKVGPFMRGLLRAARAPRHERFFFFVVHSCFCSLIFFFFLLPLEPRFSQRTTALMDRSTSQPYTDQATAYPRVRPNDTNYQQHRFARSSTIIYGSERGPREVEHPCCVLGRLCLQALTGVRR